MEVLFWWIACGLVPSLGFGFHDWLDGHDVTRDDLALLLLASAAGPLTLVLIVIGWLFQDGDKVILPGRKQKQ